MDFVSGSDVPYTGIGIKSTLTATIENTVDYLINYYSSPYITYTKVDDTIEVIITLDNAVVTYPSTPVMMF